MFLAQNLKHLPVYAENILFLRKKYDCSQDDLADLLKVKQSTISLYETGRRKMSVDDLLIVSDFFGVTLDELVKQDLSKGEVMFMSSKRITPEQGKVYKNKSGGEFLCIRGFEGNAIMQNIASGWTFNANGVIQYENGSVEWDYSTDGHFERIQKRCRLCEAKFDFRKLIINRCVGEWSLGFRGGTVSDFSDEDRVYFCPECGRELTDEDFKKKE